METIDINKFYESKDYDLFCNITKDGRSMENADIELIDYKMKPDCKISHFWWNFRFRTRAGLQYKKYKTTGTMIAAVRKEVEKQWGKLTKVWYVHDSKEHVLYYAKD